MDLNADAFIDESPLHRTDDFPSPNIVIALKSREIGNVPVRHLKYASECKTAISLLDQKTFHLPRAARITFVVVLSDDGSRIASAYANNRIYVYSVKNGEIIRSLAGHERSPLCLRFHPLNNDILASGSVNGEVRVWNIPDATSRLLSAGDKIINAVAFHPLEQLLIIATGNTLYSWDWSNSRYPTVSCSTRTERETIKYLTVDLYGRLIIGIVNDYSGKGISMCSTSSCTGPSKDDKRLHKAENWRKLLKSPLEATFPPPAASSSGELPPAASSSGKSTPLVRYISEDEATSSASSENSSHSGEIEVPEVLPREFTWYLDIDPLRIPVTSSSLSQIENTITNAEEIIHDIHSPRHRIQCFNLSCGKLPAIKNETENVVAGNCTILNQSSVDVSKDGQKLVVLISERDFKIGVFSLNKSSFGNLLCTWDNFSNALSVCFSPLASLVVVGTTYPDHILEHPSSNPVAHVIKISCVNGQYNAKRIRKFVRIVSHPHLDYFSLHDIKWLSGPELGLVYCTKTGAYTICKPVYRGCLWNYEIGMR